MDTNWVDSLSEEEAGAILKFKQSGIDSLSEEEAGIALKYVNKLKPAKKEPTQQEQTDHISSAFSDLADSFLSTDTLKSAVGGVVGTGAAVVDSLAGLVKFPLAAGAALGTSAKGNTATISREAGKEFAEDVLPSAQQSLTKGLGLEGKYAEGADAAYSTLMKPWEILTDAIEAPGKVIGGDTGEYVTMMLEAGMIAAPAAHKLGKIKAKPVDTTNYLHKFPEVPVAEKTPFTKQSVPTNFKAKEAALARSTYNEEKTKIKENIGSIVDDFIKDRQIVPEEVAPATEAPLPKLPDNVEISKQVEESLKKDTQPLPEILDSPILPESWRAPLEVIVFDKLPKQKRRVERLLPKVKKEKVVSEPFPDISGELPIVTDSPTVLPEGQPFGFSFKPKVKSPKLEKLPEKKNLTAENLEIEPFSTEAMPVKEVTNPFSIEGNGINFELRQEVLQQPEIVAAVDAFRAEAAELQLVIDNAISPKVRENAAEKLAVLQEHFASGAKELGASNAGDLHGLLRPLYESSNKQTRRGIIHGFSGKVGTLPNKRGGTGKKQGGAVNFGITDSLVEAVRGEFKSKTGKEMSVEEAILAINSRADRHAEVVNRYKALSNNPFLEKTPLSADEVKILLDEGLIKDVDDNWVKKALNSPQRAIGSTYSIRAHYNNHVLEPMMRSLSQAADAAKYKSDHLLWGENGVGTLINKLDESKQAVLWERLRSAMGKPEITEEAIFDGLPPDSVLAGKALRKAFLADLDRKNAARALENKAPLSPYANYLASSWVGDRIAMIHDAEKNLVGVASGSKADIDFARKWVSENYPEMTFTDDIFRGKIAKEWDNTNVAEIYDQILKDSKENGTSIQEELVKRMSDARIVDSERVRGVNQHEKFKRKVAVFGALGLEPWKTKGENAQNGLGAQVNHLEASIVRAELAKPAALINEFREKLGNLNAVNYAESKLQDMQGKGTWAAVKVAEDSIRRTLSETQLGEKILSGAGNLNYAATVAMNLKFFAVNASFSAINMMEAATKTPITILHGAKAAESISFWAGKRALEVVSTLSRGDIKTLRAEDKWAIDWAMQRNVGNPTVEAANTIRPRTNLNTTADLSKAFANASIKYPELISRFTAFISTYHSMRALGLEREHAANVSHDLTKLYFKDYSELEAPAIWQKLGKVGMTGGRQFRTWVLGEIASNMALIANGHVGILSTSIALTALMYGTDAVPMFTQIDKVAQAIRELLIAYSPTVKDAQKVAGILTPKEMLMQKFDGDLRGGFDRVLEQIGIEGSTVGRTQWNVIPQDVLSVIYKVKYLVDTGKSWAQAVNEISKTDPDMAQVLKNIAGPVVPSTVEHIWDVTMLTDKKGNLYNPNLKNTIPKTFHNDAERRAYMMGMQPKKSSLNSYAEQYQFDKDKQVSERITAAEDAVKSAFNYGQLRPDSHKRLEKALNVLAIAKQGGENTETTLNSVLDQAAVEHEFTPMQLKKMKALENAKNNPELAKYILQVVGSKVGR